MGMAYKAYWKIKKEICGLDYQEVFFDFKEIQSIMLHGMALGINSTYMASNKSANSAL